MSAIREAALALGWTAEQLDAPLYPPRLSERRQQAAIRALLPDVWP